MATTAERLTREQFDEIARARSDRTPLTREAFDEIAAERDNRLSFFGQISRPSWAMWSGLGEAVKQGLWHPSTMLAQKPWQRPEEMQAKAREVVEATRAGWRGERRTEPPEFLERTVWDPIHVREDPSKLSPDWRVNLWGEATGPRALSPRALRTAGELIARSALETVAWRVDPRTLAGEAIGRGIGAGFGKIRQMMGRPRRMVQPPATQAVAPKPPTGQRGYPMLSPEVGNVADDYARYGIKPLAYENRPEGLKPVFFNFEKEANLFHLADDWLPVEQWAPQEIPGALTFRPTRGASQSIQQKTRIPVYNWFRRWEHGNATRTRNETRLIDGLRAVVGDDIVQDERLGDVMMAAVQHPRGVGKGLGPFVREGVITKEEASLIGRAAERLSGFAETLRVRYNAPFRPAYAPWRRVKGATVFTGPEEYRAHIPLTARLKRLRLEQHPEYETNIFRAWVRYIREGEKDYSFEHLRTPTNEFLRKLREIGGDADDVADWLKGYTDMMEGVGTKWDRRVANAMSRGARAMGDLVGSSKLAATTPADIQRGFFRVRSSAYSGALARVSPVYRNYLQSLTHARPWLGNKYWARGWQGAVEAFPVRVGRKAGSLKATYPVRFAGGSQHRQILDRAGIVQEYLPDLPLEMLQSERGKWGTIIRRSLQGFQMSDIRTRAAAYLGKYYQIDDALTLLRAGKIDETQFWKMTQLNMHKPIVQNALKRLFASGQIDQMKHEMAYDMTAFVHYLYTRGQKPLIFRGTIVGPAFGQFGTWALHYAEMFQHLLTRGPQGWKTAATVLGTGLALQQAHKRLLGVETGNWFVMGPFKAFERPGGPLFTLGADVAKTGLYAATGQGKRAWSQAKRAARQGKVFVPAGLMAQDIWDSLTEEEYTAWERFLEAAGFRPVRRKKTRTRKTPPRPPRPPTP